jgi:hypothetical protein
MGRNEETHKMTHPALNDMDYDQLTQLIDEATNLRTTKFEGRELDQKREKLEDELEVERKADPFRSPTA